MESELAPYSYQDDPTVPDFPDDRPILFFDGDCVLCTGFARFILRHDRSARIKLATAQSAFGQAIYGHYGLEPVNFTTNMVLVRGRALLRSDAFIAIMIELRFPWSLARVLRILPVRLRDAVYDPIARNRYRIWGKRDVCCVPTREEARRFLS